ncbi:hypothetical protein PA3_23860 [Acinetobacter pittii]|uniref:Uncharacterized protein n=1 Tax=Acinetobacter pittii TaxID=48296 RepID=A0A4Y3JB98_ACIPI|nr:hypothetical protein SD67_10965 [Acinetobacter pittii]GEA68228.1 hypothetical protein PA3_23860 [Acinetobacter pittii]
MKKAYTSKINLSSTILDLCLIFMVKVILEKLILKLIFLKRFAKNCSVLIEYKVSDDAIEGVVIH